MLDESELTAWYGRLNLNDRARMLIKQIRSSEPARRVRGGRSNVSGLYPSRKMGVSIQFESHRVELAAICEMEHDPATLEFYDQPAPMMLDYNSANGRRMAVRHTPDFFVLRQDSAGWEEWKTEEDLHKLSEHNPNRYRQEAGGWHCPPGETYAAQFGLSYQVRSAKEIHWRLQRNILFIQDYLHTDPDRIPAATRERLIAYVTALGALSLADLIEQTAEFATPDDIYLLIAAGRLHVDLYAEPLAEPARVHVFPDRDAAIRCGSFPDAEHVSPAPFESFRAGAVLTWDDRIWKVVNVGSTRISLLGEDGSMVELPPGVVESLVREGRMTPPRADSEERRKLAEHLIHASEDDLQEANHRAGIVRRRLSGEAPAEGETISARTLRRWLSRYRAAESEWGAGYIGLLPRTSHRGNPTRRLPEESLRLMNQVIEGEYETVRQKSRIACWAILKENCKQQAVPAPSYTSFCLAVHQSNKFKQTLKRQGPRAAYQHGPFHMELDLKTPRHGDRPFEICHADHTELDIELTDATGAHRLGRPWMTLMIDAFSRRILAVHVDFEEPSYRSCMMMLRECVRRHNRLPQCLVVDGGPEFQSTYFEALLARYECTKKTRPPAQARFGSLIERVFGTANTQFLYNLLGNTQITRNVRQVTKTVEAIPPESGSFSWRSHFKRLLLAMNEPLVDYKRRVNPVDRTAQMMPSYPNDRGVTADYHYAVEQALRYRRPRAVLMDEAQHLFALASGRRLEDQLNVLKSLANRSNTVHVLCGTYELLRIRNLSGQLSRRSIDIHFPRYDVTKAADRQTFAKILQTFGEQMPLPEPPDLIRYWEYLYERSIGCVGILKDWLVKGLSVAIRQSAPTLTLQHLEKHALSVAQCDRLIEEAGRGESQFREDTDALGRLRLRLGFSEPARSTEPPAADGADGPRQQHPGERYPKRDAVGREQHHASSPTG